MSQASHIRCTQVAADVAGVSSRSEQKAIVEAFYDEVWNACVDRCAVAAGSVYAEHLNGNPLAATLSTPAQVLSVAVALVRSLKRMP